jgi:hypothetical protein
MLQNEVDRACDRPLRCSPQADSCADLMRKIDERAECIRARTRINARCFAGGDAHHIAMIAQAVAGLANCWTVYNAKCQQAPTPVPVTAPETARRPVELRFDRAFMEKMTAITGLTGTALIAYLIISEGSRLFPPRNLIPIP